MFHSIALLVVLGWVVNIIVAALNEEPSKRAKFDKKRWPKEYARRVAAGEQTEWLR
jgi:hypothetical protein